MSSIDASVYILSLLAVFVVAGAVFQHAGLDEYAKEGGSLVFLVNALGLRHFFSSPVFLALALVFSLNLAICAYERYKTLFAKKAVPTVFDPQKSLLLTQDASRAHEEVRRAVRDALGFRLLCKDGEWTVMEKGLPARFLTWTYHAGIIVCVIGALLTFLFAFEGTMTLRPGSPETVVPQTTGRAQSLWQERTRQTDFHIVLEAISTEYIESPGLEYPEDWKSRLAAGLGWMRPEYRLGNDPLSPRTMKAGVKLIRGSTAFAEKGIETNEPLKYGGYAFYLLGREQALKLMINDSPILLDARADNEVLVPGSTSTISFGTLRAGTVTRLDGAKERIKPYVAVKRTGSAGESALLRLRESIIVDGTVVTLAGFKESALLGYRYDPGVTALWIGGLIALAAMALRSYGPYSLLAYRIDDTDAVVCLDLHVSQKGLGASPDEIVRKIERHMTANDIRPAALPDQA